MSYRTFTRLLGETNLERKCRWLLGSGTLLLMGVSFLVYARQTEELAYDQLTHTARTLVPPAVGRQHAGLSADLRAGLDELDARSEAEWPGTRADVAFLPPTGAGDDPDDAEAVRAFRDDPAAAERTRPLRTERAFVYFAPVRASGSCVACHRGAAPLTAALGDRPDAAAVAARLARPDLQPGDLLGVARLRLSAAVIEDGFHANRAVLIAVAVGTTFLILVGSYAVIRYVVVRPVRHLKGVAEAIASGDPAARPAALNTRDEFEDLAAALNRLTDSLAAERDRSRGLIADLDRKVDELARANMELFESNRTKMDFLSTVSHELRTPLNSVIGFSEALLNAAALTDKQLRWAAHIHTSGQHLLALINDVLDLAKMESGRMRVRAEAVCVAAACEQAGGLFRPLAEKKRIELLVLVPPDTPDVRQDAGKLRQILANLLSNAVKFTPEGGRITLRAAVEGDALVLTVADTGVGIAPEHQELVFQKFRQASHTLTREQGGTGLGLSIVRELSRLLGGSTTLRSEVGRGSTFTARLSAKLADDPLAAFDDPAA